MPGNDSHKALLPALLFIFLAMLAVMFLFELAKQTINPGITTWESHAITIVFTSVLALVLVYFPLRSLHREHRKTAEALRLRQETEEKLQNTEAQYRSFVESVEDSIYTVDRDCRYLLINKRHLDRRGLSVQDYTGKTYGSFHTPAETRVFEEQVRQVVGSKSPVQAEYGKNGKYFLRNLYPVADPGSGNVIAVTVISSDITDHKKAEEALALANKKLHLLSGITRHDMNNQLQTLLSYLDLSGVSLSDPSRMAGFVEREQKIAEILAQQIAFTKNYEELGVQAPVWQNISTLVTNAAARLPVRDIKIDSGDTSLEVFADPLLETVFYNLIDNALRYGGPGMTAIRIACRKNGSGIVIACEDNGAGIPEKNKERIFSKGFGKNTGLGLFLVREILSLTGIGIAETGTEGTGARFEMTVPEGAYRFVPGR